MIWPFKKKTDLEKALELSERIDLETQALFRKFVYEKYNGFTCQYKSKVSETLHCYFGFRAEKRVSVPNTEDISPSHAYLKIYWLNRSKNEFEHLRDSLQIPGYVDFKIK